MAGIYIHIPFCKQKCSYCDFHFSTTFHSYREQMIACLKNELIVRIPYLQGQLIETIYFGGGTPSLLSEKEIASVLTVIHAHYTISPTAEITLEANPDDITEIALQAWKRCSINRLSIGLQSFREEDLQWMNRAHTAAEALKCVETAKQAGFDNISIDLMYGLPGLSLDEWKNHLRTVIDFGIQHISAYCLTVEEKTALNKWVEQRKIIPAGEDEQSEQFEILVSELKKAGIEQYEISNFSVPGHHSKHNSNYWKGKHYLGIGPSAHSFNGISRSWNIADNRAYMKNMAAGASWFETEELTIKDRFNELLLIGLRTSWGVSMEQLISIHPLSDTFLEKLKQMELSRWLTNSNGIIKLTETGKLKADYIASELFLEVESY